MNGDATGTAGLGADDSSPAKHHLSSLQRRIAASWLALEDAKRILGNSSRWESQEAQRYIVEAQGELDQIAKEPRATG